MFIPLPHSGSTSSLSTTREKFGSLEGLLGADRTPGYVPRVPWDLKHLVWSAWFKFRVYDPSEMVSLLLW